MNGRCLFYLAMWITTLLPAAGGGTLRADPPTDERSFVEALRHARFFSVAELACRRQLQRVEPQSEDYANWTVELLQTMAEHARNTPAAARAAAWQSLYDQADQALAGASGNHWRVLIQCQLALSKLAAAEGARMEAEVALKPAAALEAARQEIRQAARTLEEVEQQLVEAMRRANQHHDQDGPQADALQTLHTHMLLARARVYRNRALCYPRASNDAVAALTEADRSLGQAMSQMAADDPLRWEVELQRVRVLRILEDHAAVDRIFQQLEQAELDEQRLARVAAQRIRWELERTDWQPALKLLRARRRQTRVSVPELDFAELQIYVAAWHAAEQQHQPMVVAEYQQKATDTVRYLESRYGPYWGRRGELVLLAAAGNATLPGNLEILRRTADQLYRKQEWRQAIDAYRRLAKQAQTTGQSRLAFESRYKAALIEQRQRNFRAAGRELRQLALDYPALPQAAQAHLLAAWNLAQAVRDDRSLADEYQQCLIEHTRRFSRQPTFDQASIWLGKLLQAQRRWRPAIAAYRQVSPADPRFEEVVRAQGACWQAWLKQQASDGESIAQAAAEAVAYFESIVVDESRQWPERWSAAQRQAVLQAAQLRLHHDRQGAANAERLLAAALQRNGDAPEPWRREARLLQVAAIAGQEGRIDDARRQLAQLLDSSPAQLLVLIDQLSGLRRFAQPAVRAGIAQLELEVLDKITVEEPDQTAEARSQLARLKADALIAAGQRPEAIKILKRLADQSPQDKQLQIMLAQTLLDADDPRQLTEAMDRWRLVARRLPPDDDDWYRARYNIALAYFRRNQPGDRQEARRRLRYLQVTSQIDQSDWAAAVDKLIRQCGD